jgi:hypothetical protein
MAINGIAGTLANYLFGASNGATRQTTDQAAASTRQVGKNDPLGTLQNQVLAIRQQADAAIQSGHHEGLSSMANRMSSVVSGLSTQVSSLSSGTLSNAQATHTRNTVSLLLNTVNQTSRELSMLVPRGAASSDAGTTLSTVASSVASLAKQAGVTLQPVSVSTVSSGISARRPNLVDMLV